LSRAERRVTPYGRSIGYGEPAADAARLPVPQSVSLKRPEDFKLIGTPAKRLDTPASSSWVST
jgi:isoquinoline 1-oxidoreductase beta subunit